MKTVVTRSMERLWDIEERALPAVERGNVLAPIPVIERQGIRWSGGVKDEPLRIELTFENPAESPSVEVVAGVEVASFGAFVPWKPVTRLLVPAIPPGGRRVMTATAAAETPLPLPPQASPLDLLGSPFTALRLLREGLRASKLGPDPHFVGNLNVFVNRGKPVERHVRRAIGLAPGRDNLAMFLVGDGQQDTYTFRVSRSEPGWDARLLRYGWDTPAQITDAMIPLVIRPAERAESGGLAIAVRRKSSREEALVEFEIETAAAGSKCYFF